jgi:acetyl-CoA carboxylase carboxyl transferase subunit alpha
MATFLDFEKPIAELEARVAELRETASSGAIDIEAEVQKLQERAERLLRDTYTRLTPWQKTQVARHPERPHFKHYVEALIEDFVPLSGDRAFGEDEAIVGGLGKLGGRRILVIGHEKGDDVVSRLKHNFGMAKPEGYRKAIRLMQLADRFGLPVVSLVDTSGAFPGRAGRGARPGGGDRALHRGVPGPQRAAGGGDRGRGRIGRAIAIAAANRVLMLEHSVYSVISPRAARRSCGARRKKPPTRPRR